MACNAADMMQTCVV